MLWKQLEDESTVISLSCDSLLERATQLDQSFCAFSVPLINLNNKKSIWKRWNVSFQGEMLRILSVKFIPFF